MTSPIPQAIPVSAIGTPLGSYLLELISVADQVRLGLPVNPVPQNAPNEFLSAIAEVLRQIRDGEEANPLPQAPSDPFYQELVNAIEALR